MKLQEWAERELGYTAPDTRGQARLRYALLQVGLEPKPGQGLTEAEKAGVMAALPVPTPPEVPNTMPEQELHGLHHRALHLLHRPLPFRINFR